MKKGSTLQMVVRITGMIQLLLGLVVWTGKIEMLVLVHILVGSILTLALLMLTYRAFQAGVNRKFVLLAAVWIVILPIWGLAQDKILPDSYLLLMQILHVLCGLGAIGIGEMLGVQSRKQSA